jgi:hypothetical protein
MSNRRVNDDNGANGSLAHNAGWSDVWAGLLLTLFLLGSATSVAILFSGRNSPLSKEDELASTPIRYLQGVRELSRPVWRTADRPWELVGIHEMTPDIEDRGWGEAKSDRRYVREEATIETSIAASGPAD